MPETREEKTKREINKTAIVIEERNPVPSKEETLPNHR